MANSVFVTTYGFPGPAVIPVREFPPVLRHFVTTLPNAFASAVKTPAPFIIRMLALPQVTNSATAPAAYLTECYEDMVSVLRMWLFEPAVLHVSHPADLAATVEQIPRMRLVGDRLTITDPNPDRAPFTVYWERDLPVGARFTAFIEF